MRTIALALALLFAGAGVASAAPRHAKKHHHARSVKHAKLKRHSAVKRA